MTHDTDEHENEDTNPSRIRIIGMAVVGYALVACIGWFFLFELGSLGEQMLGTAVPENQAIISDNALSIFPTAVYLAPRDDIILTADQRGYANMLVAHDTAELATILGNNPNINLIYLHPAMLAESDANFLKLQYRNGKLIAALNTPLSVLTEKLDLPAMQDDLPFETFATAVISVSAVKNQPSGTPLTFTNAYNQFEQLPLVLDGLQ